MHFQAYSNAASENQALFNDRRGTVAVNRLQTEWREDASLRKTTVEEPESNKHYRRQTFRKDQLPASSTQDVEGQGIKKYLTLDKSFKIK